MPSDPSIVQFMSEMYEFSNKEPITCESMFRVNTALFKPQDLKLFIESIETLARLEKKRSEMREKRKLKQKSKEDELIECHGARSEQNNPENVIYSVPNKKRKVLPSPSDHAPLIATTSDLGTPSSPQSTNDESYFSGSAENSPRSSVVRRCNSDSEESGVYVADSVPLRPRSQAITTPKEEWNRARWAGINSKNDTLKKNQNLPKTDNGYEAVTEQQQQDWHHANGTISSDDNQKLYETIIKKKKRRSIFTIIGRSIGIGRKHAANSEMRFLDKAMHYLTL